MSTQKRDIINLKNYLPAITTSQALRVDQYEWDCEKVGLLSTDRTSRIPIISQQERPHIGVDLEKAVG